VEGGLAERQFPTTPPVFYSKYRCVDEDGKPTGEKELIFPRYHQMDAVRVLVSHAKHMVAGNNTSFSIALAAVSQTQ